MKPPTWRIGKRTFTLRFIPSAWFIGASRMSFGSYTEWIVYVVPMLQLTVWRQR